MVGLAYRFTHREDEALDVLQETFLYLTKKFPGFRLTAKMTTFLYPVVKHTAFHIRRRRERYMADGSLLEGVEAKDSPPRETGDLEAVLSRLSDERREVVLMRFVDGMSLLEIAEALGIPLGTVKSRLHKALSELRDDPGTARYFLE